MSNISLFKLVRFQPYATKFRGIMECVDIEGFDHYYITENADVYAPHLGRNLCSYDNGLGYRQVKMRHSVTHIRKSFFVHRLVAMCYLENIDDLSDVNHIDGDKINNHVSNLEWSSRRDNMQHAFDNKLLKGFVAKFY